MYNVGILTSLNDPLIPYFIKETYKLNNINFYLIVSKEKEKTKDLKIFKDRTGDHFLKDNLDLFSVDTKLSTFLVSSHNSQKFYKIIKDKNIEFLFNSGTPNKISIKTIKKVKGVINIHPGVLPLYRGCTCPEWTLFNNDPLGITAHFMNISYDSGPIIKIEYLKFKKKDIKEYKDVRIKLFELIFKLARTIFKKLNNTNTKIKISKQEEYEAKYYKVIKNNYLSIVKKKIKDKKYKFNKINLIK